MSNNISYPKFRKVWERETRIYCKAVQYRPELVSKKAVKSVNELDYKYEPLARPVAQVVGWLVAGFEKNICGRKLPTLYHKNTPKLIYKCRYMPHRHGPKTGPYKMVIEDQKRTV
jgi:hypothetical protein